VALGSDERCGDAVPARSPGEVTICGGQWHTGGQGDGEVQRVRRARGNRHRADQFPGAKEVFRAERQVSTLVSTQAESVLDADMLHGFVLGCTSKAYTFVQTRRGGRLGEPGITTQAGVWQRGRETTVGR
jgi:hypothetical protein